MSLERRLQHAARELRAVDVAVPPLGSTGARSGPLRRFGFQVVAVPLMFVLGGLVVVGVLDDRRDTGGSFDDTPVVVDRPAPVDAPAGPAVSSASTPVAPSSLARPSADAELVVIDRIVTTAAQRADDAPAPIARLAPLDFGPL